MIYDLVLVGFGVITSEVLSELFKKKIRSNLNIAVIEKGCR